MSFRPANETDLHLRTERAVIARVAGIKNYSGIHKLSPALYGIDYALGVTLRCVSEFAEVKCRDRWYSDMLLSAGKYAKACGLSRLLRVPVRLYVHIDGDGIYEHTLLVVSGEYELRIHGSSRGQPGDIEPCIMIKRAAFARLCESIW